jgi:endonuclease/exonuclease/phosphatase family metal-dependent hydrolase
MLRVMTLNLWNLSGPWRQRRDEAAAWIARLAPDVVCLQEVVQGRDGRDQAKWLARADAVAPLGYDTAFGPGLDLGEQRWFGNAVMTRRGIEHLDCVPLPALDAPPEGRIALHVRTGGVDVFCTHLNWQFHHGYIREAQVSALAAAVRERADARSSLPPIVAGDLNAEPTSTEIRFLTGLASLDGASTFFQDAWRIAGVRSSEHDAGWTWDNRNPFAAQEHEPDRRIDYVLVGWRRDGGAGVVQTARVVCNRSLTGTFASDHFGLLAEIAS